MQRLNIKMENYSAKFKNKKEIRTRNSKNNKNNCINYSVFIFLKEFIHFHLSF